MRPKQVCFVLPSFDVGGAQRVALNLLATLDPVVFAPKLIVFQGNGPLADQVPVGIPLIELGCRRLRDTILRLPFALRRARPDVVFSTLGYVNLAILGMRPILPHQTRILIRESNTPSQSLPALPYAGLLRTGYRLLYRSADVIICQSKLIEHELAKYYDVPTRRMARLPNPVDEQSIRLAASPPIRMPGTGHRFVATGALIEQKGFDRLIDLFAESPDDAHLTIIGEGPERERLTAQVRGLGLSGRVALQGFSPNPWPAIAGADALLLPSRWEGMPNVALEALACGTPVIGTPESGGLSEVAELVSPGAVTLAAIGPEFHIAMCNAMMDPTDRPRASLLPGVFGADEVGRAFAALLAP